MVGEGLKLEYSRWGLANRFGDTIVLHQDLRGYPGLHDSILRHERGHTQAIFHNLKHDYLDIIDSPLKLMFFKMKFMLVRPKTWTQVLPVYVYKKRPYIDLSMLLVYFLALTILVIGWWI